MSETDVRNEKPQGGDPNMICLKHFCVWNVFKESFECAISSRKVNKKSQVGIIDPNRPRMVNPFEIMLRFQSYYTSFYRKVDIF